MRTKQDLDAIQKSVEETINRIQNFKPSAKTEYENKLNVLTVTALRIRKKIKGVLKQ